MTWNTKVLRTTFDSSIASIIDKTLISFLKDIDWIAWTVLLACSYIVNHLYQHFDATYTKHNWFSMEGNLEVTYSFQFDKLSMEIMLKSSSHIHVSKT